MATEIIPKLLEWEGESALKNRLLDYTKSYTDINDVMKNLTPQEQQAMKFLDEYFQGGQSTLFKAGSNEIQKTLDGGYDPATSDYYKPIVSGIDRLRAQTTDRLRRGSQIGGNLTSLSRVKAEGDLNTQYDAYIADMMLGLSERERQRKIDVLPQAGAYGQYGEEYGLRKAEALRNNNIPRGLQTQALDLGQNILTRYQPTYYYPQYAADKKRGGFGAALGGAISGAQAGSAFGPYGAAIGGGAGALMGYFS